MKTFYLLAINNMTQRDDTQCGYDVATEEKRLAEEATATRIMKEQWVMEQDQEACYDTYVIDADGEFNEEEFERFIIQYYK